MAGKFFGKSILFTGDFDRPKSILEAEAARIGFKVASNASKQVDLLVVGAVDKSVTKGSEKTGKHLRIEALIEQGHTIHFIGADKLDALFEFGRSG